MLASVTQTHTQPTSFDRISIEHGLPSHYITAMHQDAKGFMWIGTDAGLCRYDGQAFKVFKNLPADSTSLAGNSIWSLYEDRESNLWVGTYNGGLNRLDLKTEKITRMVSSGTLPAALTVMPIKALLVDRNNVLWIGTFGGGLGMLDLKTQAFRMFTHDSLDEGSLPSNTVFCIVEDRSGRLWFGTAQGVCVLDSLHQRFTTYSHDPKNPQSLSNNVVVTVFEDHRNRFWVGTKDGLNLLDRKTGTMTRFTTASKAGPSNNSIYAIGGHATRYDTSLWIGTDGGGVHRYDETAKAFIAFRNVADDITSISDDHVTCASTDRTGTLWIGTLQGGVSKIETKKKKVSHLRYEPSNPNSILKGPVYSLSQDSTGKIWIGTYAGGLCAYSSQPGKFQRYTRESEGNLASNDIPALLTDRTGILWIGTNDAGLMKFDSRLNRFVPFSNTRSNQNRASAFPIDELFEDRSGGLWIGTNGGGLLKYDRWNDVVVQFLPNQTLPGSLSHVRVTVIRESRDGKLWIGTEGGGVNRFDPTTREFTHFRYHTADSNGLSDDLVYAVQEDRKGLVWIGTSNGLNSLNPVTGKIKRYFTRDGMASDYIKGILEDARNNLWLITARGVSRMSPDRSKIVNFDHRDGFINYGFNDAYLITSTGHIFLGGSEGIDIFHPDSLVENTHVPPIVLTEFTVYNKPHALPQAISFTAEIPSLEWNQNFFSITFAVLDFAAPDRNRFGYQMVKEGDEHWISSGSTRFANFTNLDHGTYIFTATGANSNGVWNRTGITLRITIKPPFWQTPWFIALMIAAVIGILAAIYNYRVTQLLKIERLRLHIASDLHDDVGSSLSAIALMTDLVGRKLPSGSAEREGLHSVTAVARSTADALRDIVWIINPEHEKVEDMLLRMKDVASKLLVNIDYTFHADKNGLSNILNMELRRNVILIYKEMLNNIARHSHATQVEITVSTTGGLFLLRIRDNGRGFDENDVKKGSGLNNFHLRSRKIGGSTTIQSTPGKGTAIEFRVKIP